MAQFGVSFVATVYAWDTSAGTYKTGDSANITLYWNKDGTNGTTTNACSEVSSSNVPGQYKVTITAAEAACTNATLGGKSSTANIIIIPQQFAFDTSGLADVGTLQSATGTTAVLRSGAVATDSYYVGATLFITSGTGAGQSRVVTAYVGSSKTVTVDTWTTNPDSTSTYALLATAPSSTAVPPQVDVKKWNSTAVATPTTAGIPEVNVKNIAGTAQTARDIGASVLLSNGTGTGQVKLASGYVAMTWADIAAPTTTVNLSGTTIGVAAALTANNDKTGYTLSNTGMDNLLTRAMTEAYSTAGATHTLAQFTYDLKAALTNFSISGTTITAKKLDNSTTAATYTLDSATVPTSRARAT